MSEKQTTLGIELGSTRIKAVLIDESHQVIAQGSHTWENQLVNGIWTYSMDAVTQGIQDCYADLKENYQNIYHKALCEVGAIGVSAMMHGYLPLDKNGVPLTEFRTWRNTITGQSAEKLTEVFDFNIPQRWSIAHLYQAILNKEDHIKDISYLTTLAGYIHWRLTGEKVMGVGEASGMFPIDSESLDYNAKMIQQFDSLIAEKQYPWKIYDILPKVLVAGEVGGKLTEEGAKFLDPQGDLKAGILVAPCEGDAGTGMTATNSVAVYTGNVSAGTSDFAMIVTDHELGVHREIDMVTTPAGHPVAMVHCNNCTSDINAWIKIFMEFAETMGMSLNQGEVFTTLFNKAMEADMDCGGLLSYNYLSGEGVTDIDEGRPMFLRMPDAKFNLANFMRTHLLSALATLKIGLDILNTEEKVRIDKLYGHGGFFKTPNVGQTLLSAATGAPVTVMETAGEGGPYGMALLAGYMIWKEENESLETYLEKKVFSDAKTVTLKANEQEQEGFDKYLALYQKTFKVEKTAVEEMKQC